MHSTRSNLNISTISNICFTLISKTIFHPSNRWKSNLDLMMKRNQSNTNVFDFLFSLIFQTFSPRFLFPVSPSYHLPPSPLLNHSLPHFYSSPSSTLPPFFSLCLPLLCPLTCVVLFDSSAALRKSLICCRHNRWTNAS